MTQLASYFEPLILAAVGVASKMLDHQQQMTVLDQTKTLAESALQMLYAAKEGGGNPKVCFKPWGGGGDGVGVQVPPVSSSSSKNTSKLISQSKREIIWWFSKQI